MLTIRFRDAPELDESDVQGVLFTSANGVRAYAQTSARRDLPVFAVGDRTADAAQSSGFASVHSANGDVASLAALVQKNANPKDGPLLHPAGSATAGDLSGLLGEAGFTLRRVVLYDAKQAKALSKATETALCSGDIDMILFYSSRTAATFTRLAVGLKDACSDVDILCLSHAVAEAAQNLKWRRIFVAQNPTQADLLALLDERLNGS